MRTWGSLRQDTILMLERENILELIPCSFQTRSGSGGNTVGRQLDIAEGDIGVARHIETLLFLGCVVREHVLPTQLQHIVVFQFTYFLRFYKI